MAYPVPRPQPRQTGLLGLGGNQFLGDALNAIGTGLLGLGSGRDDWGLLAMQGLQAQQQNRLANTRQSEQDQRAAQTFEFQRKRFEAEQQQDALAAKEKAAKDAQFKELLPTLPPGLQATAQAMGPGFVDLWGREQIQGLNQSDAPIVKDFYEGGNVIQKQWNPQTGAWDQVGAGPRFAPQQPNAPEAPSSVREYEFFSSLSPEDQQKYLTIKRAADWQNLGGSMTLPNPLDPAGAPTAVLPKTLPPQDTPQVRGEQAAAVATAQNDADAAAAAGKKDREAATTLDVLEGVETIIDQATGSAGGAAVDTVASWFGKSTEGAAATAQLRVLEAKLMTTMPRMEGPQSNLDVNLYRQAAGQIGDPMVPRDIKKAAVQTIRQLQAKYPSAAAAQQPAAPTDLKSKYGLE